MPEDEIRQPPGDDSAEETEIAFTPVAGNGSEEPEIDSNAAVTADGAEEPDSPTAFQFPIVAIGGSAGGVEAYMELFRHLDARTGMAFVLISHLPPAQKSHLPEIIARNTRMPTSTIESGVRPEPNQVYLLPPNAQVSLRDGAFQLEDRTGERIFRPIDHFFQSLAAAQKNLAIGIVLSGMDADGSIGLKAIKAESGITIVQLPESARYPEMPRSSLLADHVDMVLPPERMGKHLAQLAESFRNPELRTLEAGSRAPDEDKYLTRILRLLKGVSGVDFRLYKPTTIRRRIARRMLMRRIDSLADYAAILPANPKELRELQEDILISVTRFFRDPDVFEALKTTVFRQLFEDRAPEQQVRIWVPGCSSGEEVYSIAISLLEFLTGSALEPPIQIFGTDASERSIQKARAGFYPETIASEVSPERLRRFFIKTEKGYQISKRLRDLCIFARQNLCNDPPFSRLDLVSCRNILIYFGSQLQRQIIPTFHYSLRPEGYLLLGNSETIREFTDLFRLIDRKNKIYFKIGATPQRALLEAGPRLYVPDIPGESTAAATGEPWFDPDIQRAADRIVLARYGPPGVVVNEKLEILQSRGHTSPYLELGQGTASLHLTRMVREGVAPQVTAAVRRAIEQDLPVQVEKLQVRDGDQMREAMLEILPMHNASSRRKCYLVLFVPANAPVNARPATASDFLGAEAGDGDKDRVVAQLRHDLSSTKLYLQSLLEERDAKNQELISANEEIQSANEELQSTNEELETTKEELQSSNEELQTVNDELQNRNTVLTQTSNDLSNLLNSVNLPVLMLSSEFSIRHFTPQTQRLMNVRASDVGRPFGDIRLNLNIDHLEPLFTEVLDTLGSREIEVQDHEGHWYLLRVRPYRTTDNKIDGLVVVLVDIDQLRRSQQELRDARDFARSIIESIPLPLAVVDSEFRIRSTNEAFSTLAGTNGQNLERRFLPDLAAVLWGMEQPLRSMLEDLRRGNGSEKERSFEFEYKASGDSPKVFLVHGCVLRPDGEQFLLVTFEDVSAHIEVERLLKAESARLASEVQSTTNELDRSREELRALTGSLLMSQEEERRRVARELHDDVGQRLASLSITLDDAVRNLERDPMRVRQVLEGIAGRTGQLSEDVRTLSHGLHPSIIEDLGLAAALRMLTNEFGEREDMIVTFLPENVPEEIPIEIATGLYRITQEALRNIAKHAGKSHVKLILSGKTGDLVLQVADSGKGFDMAHRKPGLGLISIEERTRLMGGTSDVRSAPREGTKVTVIVPLHAKA